VNVRVERGQRSRWWLRLGLVGYFEVRSILIFNRHGVRLAFGIAVLNIF